MACHVFTYADRDEPPPGWLTAIFFLVGASLVVNLGWLLLRSRRRTR